MIRTESCLVAIIAMALCGSAVAQEPHCPAGQKFFWNEDLTITGHREANNFFKKSRHDLLHNAELTLCKDWNDSVTKNICREIIKIDIDKKMRNFNIKDIGICIIEPDDKKIITERGRRDAKTDNAAEKRAIQVNRDENSKHQHSKDPSTKPRSTLPSGGECNMTDVLGTEGCE